MTNLVTLNNVNTNNQILFSDLSTSTFTLINYLLFPKELFLKTS